jgi:hypothetical protein
MICSLVLTVFSPLVLVLPPPLLLPLVANR